MAGVWRHPLGAGNRTELLSSQGTGAGGFQVHLLRCTEVEKSSGGEEPKATWRKLSGASFLLLQCCLSSLSAPSTDSSAPEMFQAGWRSFLLLAFPFSSGCPWPRLPPQQLLPYVLTRAYTHQIWHTGASWLLLSVTEPFVQTDIHHLCTDSAPSRSASLTASHSNSQVHVSLSKQGFVSLHVLRPSILSF